jgi:hypothetical protein
VLGHELLVNDAYQMQALRHPCTIEPEFVYTISSLASVINNVRDKESIFAGLEKKPIEGSINLLE